MTAFRITITDAQGSSDGSERHTSYSAARRSAVRSAVSIILDKKSDAAVTAASCEIHNEHSGVVRRFIVELVVGPDRLG